MWMSKQVNIKALKQRSSDIIHYTSIMHPTNHDSRTEYPESVSIAIMCLTLIDYNFCILSFSSKKNYLLVRHLTTIEDFLFNSPAMQGGSERKWGRGGGRARQEEKGHTPTKHIQASHCKVNHIPQTTRVSSKGKGKCSFV